ncbi:hypothetical protein SNE25_06740 [Mucilaginibacter sabulilitoris]|uniref:Uncharacterized protein n=1 Tax=Mucilaginibacter sabulilitoris TaxID=1173583 RepID=A0ABZ0TPZ0_9SPHI|nr:hypothetical protein [Mucilaginibacter sabulilitoris]WPU95219.1 hypothetical protein SNE25_06740 [Mucilaginibacter sabulilitoris]
MIFLSSQPDDFYFLWQLQLQLFNFRSLGIPDADIHILLGYDVEKGLAADFEQFIVDNPFVNIHAYPDTRKSKFYAPSIRWHIIAKHLKKFPGLQKVAIFHHDSDIVFKSLPDFDLLSQDDTWYAADSRSYLDSSYIKNTAGEEVFDEMCRIVGVNRELVESDDKNAGGAQYLLKQVSLEFLIKMEDDSEKMYKLLTSENQKRMGFCGRKGNNALIQAWCADMWVIWWSAIYFKKRFLIHKELDFAWADSSIEALNYCKTLHYTGSVDKKKLQIFRKGDFVNYTPFNQDLSRIDQNTCSYFLRCVLEDYVRSNRSKRHDLMDVTFLITIDSMTSNHLEEIYAVTRYLIGNFHTRIVIRELCQTAKIDIGKLPNEVIYEVVSKDGNLNLIGHLNQMIGSARTPYVAVWSAEVIIPVRQIMESILHLRNNKYSYVKPYSKVGLKVDMILKEMFVKIQDVNLFEENKNKMREIPPGNNWDAVFINKSVDQNYATQFDPEGIIENTRRAPMKSIEGHIFYLDNFAS